MNSTIETLRICVPVILPAILASWIAGSLYRTSLPALFRPVMSGRRLPVLPTGNPEKIKPAIQRPHTWSASLRVLLPFYPPFFEVSHAGGYKYAVCYRDARGGWSALPALRFFAPPLLTAGGPSAATHPGAAVEHGNPLMTVHLAQTGRMISVQLVSMSGP